MSDRQFFWFVVFVSGTIVAAATFSGLWALAPAGILFVPVAYHCRQRKKSQD
jgi:hypothetical protein